ncbi:hypothetical protein A2U01_0048904 [Trifolium medium]|uniref:Uncharacterized protein n=1 Tax=Trifolium medium TaxID=97028 RepID=A0A392QV47_9FABA|nr:hypothetical protein [Trifolium medium]
MIALRLCAPTRCNQWSSVMQGHLLAYSCRELDDKSALASPIWPLS